MRGLATRIHPYSQCGLAFIITTFCMILPDLAFAAVDTTVSTGLCSVADEFRGGVASGIATIAVCTIGAMACLGRIQWTTAVVVATGIAVMFGAATLVPTIAGNNSDTGC